MEQNHHYSGLTDAQVLESRKKHGVNVLTPPEEQSVWDKIKECMHFWLLDVVLGLAASAAVIIPVLRAAGVTMPSEVWVGPLILLALFLLTYVVTFMGGNWDAGRKKFSMDPLITILLAALVFSGAISFYQGVFGGETGMQPYFEPIGIAVAVLLATGVSYILERQNEKTFKSLNEVNDETPVKVIRNSNVCQVPRRDIVVGDVVILETGEEIPADCELLEALNLNVNESTLTGEPQCLKTVAPEAFDKDATYPSNHIMKGCMVLEGYCTARVFAVGDSTASGKVFEAAQVKEGDATPLSEKLDELAGLVTKASYAIAALIIVGRIAIYFIQGNVDFTGTDGIVAFVKYLLDTVMIAVTLIVVAVPEGLPMAVTLSLAFSMKRLMKQNTLPRTMHACETMGAASVICTDKTGTLTRNQMEVWETAFPSLKDQTLGDDEASRYIKECIAVNTTANLDFADRTHIKAIGNPTEGALLLWLDKAGVNYLPLREEAEILDRLPFSTELKYMATIVRSKVSGKRVLYVKGAPEIIMGLCVTSEGERNEYESKLAAYQHKAMRTLGFAFSELADDQDVFMDGKLNCGSLRMMGVVAISDPVREDVPAAIKECLDAGVEVKIVTGDTPGTAIEIGRQVGLWTASDGEESILTGQDIVSMGDEELEARLPGVKIISRARPNDKERVVRALKKLGYVVAVTGDGTNDAPALNAANVGLSMGDGTAVAKEASDMTILDNSFGTIANAVMWGRSLYKNIKRFILFQMTVNFTACFIVLAGAFIGTESPLTVTQMLWMNLIMDTFAALALASLPPDRKVMEEKPRSVDEHILKGIGKNILAVGLTFAFICLGILLYLQHNDVTSLVRAFPLRWGAYDGLTPYELGLFFTIFVMLHFFNLFNAKAYMTTDSAFKGLSWNNTRWFILITAIILVVQIAIVEVPGLQEMFNVGPGGLKPVDWIIILAGTSFVIWIGEIKHLIARKTK